MSTAKIIGTGPKKARTPQRRSLALRDAIAAVAAEFARLVDRDEPGPAGGVEAGDAHDPR